MIPQEILIDIRTCDMTLSQVMAEIGRLQAGRPESAVFRDGEAYAVVARRRNQQEGRA